MWLMAQDEGSVEEPERPERRLEERDRLEFVSFGFFLVLVGTINLITPNIYSEFVAFFKDFKLVEVAPNLFFPSPASNHPIVYGAVMKFCFAFGLFQVVILGLRFVFRDTLGRKAGTLSGIIFWLGAGFLSNMLLTENIDWFAFLSGLIIFVGLSLVVRSLVVLLFGGTRQER